MKQKLVSASLLSADKIFIKEDMIKVIDNGVDFIHFDVMDGNFVNNVSFNDDTFIKIRKDSKVPFEIHLMVENPFSYIDNYEYSASDIIIVHLESFVSEEDLLVCLKRIKKHHKVGISIKPNTDCSKLNPYLELLDYVLIMSVEPGFGGQKFIPSSLEKIRYFAKKQDKYSYLIEVDGGINQNTAKECFDAGVDIVVSGSYLFKGDPSEKVKSLK